MSDDPIISYSVKEVLGRIEGKLDNTIATLALKADQATVNHLNERLDEQGGRIAALENDKRSRAEHMQWITEWRRWLIPTLLSAAATIALILSVVHP